MFIAGLAALPGVGLILWVNFVLTQAEEKMGSWDGVHEPEFEGHVTHEHRQQGFR